MLELLVVLKDTPVPSILVIGGLIFILLAFAGTLAGQVTIPQDRQKQAGLLGVFLLFIGTTLYLIPTILNAPPVSKSPIPPTPTTTFTTTFVIPSATVPSFSPTPQTAMQIIYVSDIDGDTDIYIANTDGTGQLQLTHNNALDLSPAVSLNGRYIAFISNQDYDHADRSNIDIYVMTIDSSYLLRLTTDGGEKSRPSFDRNGQRIAFGSKSSGDWEIYTIRVDGTDLQSLTNGEGGEYAAWSPNGNALAFTSYRDTRGEYAQLYLMDTNGMNVRRITNTGAYDSGAAWSPDGTKIAFHTNRDGNWEIYVMNTDGTGQRNVSQDPNHDDSFPSWSPDGRTIAFQKKTEDGISDIYFIDSNGANLHKVFENSIFPVWTIQ